MRPLEVGISTFFVFLEGLPADSAFASIIQEEREEAKAWREKLGSIPGSSSALRDPNTTRRVLHHGAGSVI